MTAALSSLQGPINGDFDAIDGEMLADALVPGAMALAMVLAWRRAAPAG